MQGKDENIYLPKKPSSGTWSHAAVSAVLKDARSDADTSTDVTSYKVRINIMSMGELSGDI